MQMSPGSWVSPLNSRLVYPTPALTFPLESTIGVSNITSPKWVMKPPQPYWLPPAFPISGRGTCFLPGAQVKNRRIILDLSFSHPHPVCQQVLSATQSQYIPVQTFLPPWANLHLCPPGLLLESPLPFPLELQSITAFRVLLLKPKESHIIPLLETFQRLFISLDKKQCSF